MTLPNVAALTAGELISFQMMLGSILGGARTKKDTWVVDGGQGDLLPAARRHANLAQNAGIFIAGFSLIEFSGWQANVLFVQYSAFVALRLR